MGPAKATGKKSELEEFSRYSVDEVDVSRSDFSAIGVLLRYGKGFYWQLAGVIALMMIVSGFLMASARILGSLVEGLTGQTSEARLWVLAALILFFEAMAILFTYIGRVRLSALTTKIVYQIRLDLFGKISRLPIAYFDRQPLGRTITRLTSDIDGIEKFFSGPMTRVLSSVITIGSVLTAMLVTDFRLGIVVVAASMPALFFTFALRGPVRSWLRAYKIRSSAINAKLAELINGFPVIKIFGLEKWAGDSHNQLARAQRDAGVAILNWNSFVRPTASLLSSVPTVVILWWGGLQVLEGALGIGLVVAFVRYAERFYWPVMALSQEVQVIQEAIASSERVRQMQIEMDEESVLGSDGDHAGEIKGRVRFEDVWMGYQPGRPILKGVSFDIQPGMTIGLVGATGSGKTSTLNLLPMLYPVSKGRILIDETPITEWRRMALRSQIGIVSQDIVIFRGTLRDNLVVAARDPSRVSDEKLQEYCKKTGLDQIMHQFPAGFDTQILDGGENLSVGERQLIAFTRMLVRDPSVFILDEATANIDEEYERLVQSAIEEIMHDRTCFVIAHRLNTILQCDRILVFDNGQIIEQGSHEELMAQKGHYAALAASQLAASEAYS